MTKTILFSTAILILTISCQSAPTPTAIPPTRTPTPLPPTPNISAILTVTAPREARGLLNEGTIRIGEINRKYSYHVPANLPTDAPLLFALHGRGGSGHGMRSHTGYEFNDLADQNGFIVVYPDGRNAYWVSCFPDVPSSLRTQGIEDMAFFRAMIAQFHSDYSIDRSRVFAMGFSSGGFMAYRFALEMPNEFTAVAAVGASLQTESTNVCRPLGKPIPVMIMNGTADPRVPYDGGRTGLSGTLVLSARATAEYFAVLNGQTKPPTTTRLPHRVFASPGSVDRTVWNDPGKPEVVLLTVNGGGHDIPLPPADLDGPAEIWDFFSRQPPLK